MQFTQRRTRSTLRAVIPLLALVWTSLPLHHCNLAYAGQAAAAVGQEAQGAAQAPSGDAAMTPCGHHLTDPAQPARSTLSCSDLGRAGPDLRPALVFDAVLVHISYDSRWFDRGLRPVLLFSGHRQRDDGGWRQRRLHLQKSALLI